MTIFHKLFNKPANTRKNLDADHEDTERAYAIIMRHANAAPMTIDTHVDPETFKRLQNRVEDTWSRLGQEDAHWSVITDEKFRKESLSSHIDQFFSMGDGDIARLDAALNRVGTSLSNIESAMDFGCGVGRLSVPMARSTGHVLGVDISAAHLREAKANVARMGCQNIELVRASSIQDIKNLPEFELVLSLIVLQHNPPPVMLEILNALCSRVKPGGYLYVQAQTYRQGYRYCATDDLADTLDKMEMHVLPQHVFLETIQGAGLTILEVTENGAAWDLSYKSQVVLARKR
ncbi:class I SAM-dependent methyltransferase [Roseovarius sp. D0-M9]|uniref:class I SAM-dependent methyltransferase n=1 Tax=Roseovarius sp. D0-M9 TaxID=3127117 RepID=UPI0030104622